MNQSSNTFCNKYRKAYKKLTKTKKSSLLNSKLPITTTIYHKFNSQHLFDQAAIYIKRQNLLSAQINKAEYKSGTVWTVNKADDSYL